MDQYIQALQAEAQQNVATQQIRTQVDIANKQAQISSSGNAVMNAGIVMGSIGKAGDSLSMIFNAVTAPRDMSVMANQMIGSLKALNPGQTAAQLIGKDTAQRISNLTDLLRKNPDASLAKANIDSAIKAGSTETRTNSLLSDFNLKYGGELSRGGIDGTISDPMEFQIAERMRGITNAYESYVRGARNLTGNDAEVAVNKVSSRLKDILESRFNQIRSKNGPIDLDEESELGKVARTTYTRVKSYAEDVLNRVKGYARQVDDDLVADVGAPGTEMGSVERFAQSMLLRRPQDILRNTLARFSPSNTEGAAEDTIQMNNLNMAEEEGSLAVRAVAPPPASNLSSASAPESIGSQELAFPEATEIAPTFTESTVQEVESSVQSSAGRPALWQGMPSAEEIQASGFTRMSTDAPESIQAVAAQTSKTITAQPEGVGVATEAAEAAAGGAAASEEAAESATSAAVGEAGLGVSEAAGAAGDVLALAGEAGAGIAESAGEALSLAGGPIGLLVGLGGLAFSLFQALSGEATPQPQIATPVAPGYNPISSEAPASSMHF